MAFFDIQKILMDFTFYIPSHLPLSVGSGTCKRQHITYMLEMDQNGEQRDLGKTTSGEMLNKCNQCDYACSGLSGFWTHLKTHSGEKSNKCIQCDYVSNDAGNLRRHSKRHRSAPKGEK